MIVDINGDKLSVEAAADATWTELVQLLQNGTQRWIGGTVETYANAWGFRFNPNTIFVAEITVEAIQSTIQGISQDLDYWLGKTACVWANVVKAYGSPDINRDRVVDIKDLTLVVEGYGCNGSASRYNPKIDLNYDLLVDVQDLFRVSIHFNETAG